MISGWIILALCALPFLFACIGFIAYKDEERAADQPPWPLPLKNQEEQL